MLENTYAILKNVRYDVYIFNLDTPEYSNRRNLLANVIKAYLHDLDDLFDNLPVGHPAKMDYAASKSASG